MPINPSLSARRNLWKSKTEENRYARELRGLLSEAGAEIKSALQTATVTNPDGSTYTDMEQFSSAVRRILETILTTKGQDMAERHAKAGMLLGISYSDTALKEAFKEAGIDVPEQ